MAAAINPGPDVRPIRRTKPECAKDADRLTKGFHRHGPPIGWGNLDIGSLSPSQVQVVIGLLCWSGVITRYTVTIRTGERIIVVQGAREQSTSDKSGVGLSPALQLLSAVYSPAGRRRTVASKR